MILVRGKDMWTEELGKADLILFTANSTLDKNKHLVMGAGAALEAKTRFPELPDALGELVETYAVDGFYGVLSVNFTSMWVGAFQTKYHWRDKSILELIEKSTEELMDECIFADRIAMNFPGIGKGGLTEAEVMPIISRLPDNVFVYI